MRRDHERWLPAGLTLNRHTLSSHGLPVSSGWRTTQTRSLLFYQRWAEDDVRRTTVRHWWCSSRDVFGRSWNLWVDSWRKVEYHQHTDVMTYCGPPPAGQYLQCKQRIPKALILILVAHYSPQWNWVYNSQRTWTVVCGQQGKSWTSGVRCRPQQSIRVVLIVKFDDQWCRKLRWGQATWAVKLDRCRWSEPRRYARTAQPSPWSGRDGRRTVGLVED